MIDDFRSEYRRYRTLGERALAQMSDDGLNHVPSQESNSAAMIVRHVSGNLASRFTDFLQSDGEKPWRDRDREFDDVQLSRAEVEKAWASGFAVLDAALDALTDADMSRTVTIRQQPLTVHAALTRSVAHVAYHAGQLVLLARAEAGAGWKSLSIPRGMSDAYNAAPTNEKGLK